MVKSKCNECGQSVNGPHSVIPGAEAHVRAELLRADGWRITSRFPGCMWHGEWLMYPPGDDWPAWHCAMSLEELLHMMDTRPAEDWSDIREELDREFPAWIPPARPPVKPVRKKQEPRPAQIQLSLFA